MQTTAVSDREITIVTTIQFLDRILLSRTDRLERETYLWEEGR
jgi:hypothetical protein